jgi:hypothetical protein
MRERGIPVLSEMLVGNDDVLMLKPRRHNAILIGGETRNSTRNHNQERNQRGWPRA